MNTDRTKPNGVDEKRRWSNKTRNPILDTDDTDFH